MKPVSRKPRSALDVIRRVQSEVENAKPSREQMLEDVKMMQFKIRPVFGDIAILVKKDNGFLEALWKIGKMEEIINHEIVKLNPQEKEVFFHYWHHKQGQIQTITGGLRHNPDDMQNQTTILEIEVVKTAAGRKKILN